MESSVTKLGYFWKVLEAYFLSKLAKISRNFFVPFYKRLLLRKNCFGFFFGNFGENWALLILVSGHTDGKQ